MVLEHSRGSTKLLNQNFGKSVKGFLSSDRTYKQRLLLYKYRIDVGFPVVVRSFLSVPNQNNLIITNFFENRFSIILFKE